MTQLNSPRRTPNRHQTTPSEDSPTAQTLRAEPENSQGHETTHNHYHQHQHQHQHQNQHHQTSVSDDDVLSQLTDYFTKATDFSRSVPQAHLPQCNGFTAKNARCQRHGAISVEFNSTNKNNSENLRHCYQHEPSISVDRQCLAIAKTKKRQCLVTCSLSEIRPGDLPICNTHYGTNAKIVSR